MMTHKERPFCGLVGLFFHLYIRLQAWVTASNHVKGTLTREGLLLLLADLMFLYKIPTIGIKGIGTG